jgi:hypothetical protein
MDNNNVAVTVPSAVWTRNDEATLVHSLKKAKDDGKWGDNNPKGTAWTACVAALSGSENVSGGGPKTAKAIKNRWQRVRVHHISCIVCASSYPPQLKQEYAILKIMRDRTGWGWNNTTNTPEVSDEVWDAYIEVSQLRLSYSPRVQLMLCVDSFKQDRSEASPQERVSPLRPDRRACGRDARNR